MLTVYLDESGTHRGSRICAMGGLVASAVQWERLTASWNKVLNDVHVGDFHAADCANGGGSFAGWDKEAREKLYVRLVNLTARMTAYRVWTAVVMDDYHQIFNDHKEKFPYTLCALGCASRLLWIAKKREGDFRISYVFDQGEKGRKTFATFDKIHRRGDVYRMGSLTKDSRLRMVPLQAADLHAYEVYRYFADQMTRRENNKLRGSFRELLKVPDGGGYLLTGEKLELMSREVVRQRIRRVNEPIEVPLDRLDREHIIKLHPPQPPGLHGVRQ